MLSDVLGDFYLVLEFVSGGSLSQLLRERSSLPLDLAIQVTADLCDALEAVWKEGIVHRDIKPNNIFLAKDESGGVVKAKLAYFGVALTSRETRATSSPTQRGAHPGTPRYMWLERAKGRPFLDVRSDLYAIGLVLYEMVDGKVYRSSTVL
jgi:serine/threonine protein kinase